MNNSAAALTLSPALPLRGREKFSNTGRKEPK
jgi:hypothetical protein